MPLRTEPTTRFHRRLAPRPFRDRDVELYEDRGTYVLTVEMPGFDVEDIDVRWADGALAVSAEREDDGRERTFHRRFRLPKAVEDDDIAAEYENGVLEVRLPVAGAAARGTEIPVES